MLLLSSNCKYTRKLITLKIVENLCVLAFDLYLHFPVEVTQINIKEIHLLDKQEYDGCVAKNAKHERDRHDDENADVHAVRQRRVVTPAFQLRPAPKLAPRGVHCLC